MILRGAWLAWGLLSGPRRSHAMTTFVRFVFCTLALAGCGSDVDDMMPGPADPAPLDPADPPPVVPTLEQRLAAGESLMVLAEHAELSFTAAFPGEIDPPPTVLHVVHGRVELGMAADEIEITGLEVALHDMTVAPDRYDIHLTDIAVTLAGPASGPTTFIGDEAHAEVEVDLLLDWSLMRPDGSHWPLEQQRIPGVLIDVSVRETAEGTLSAELGASAGGRFLRWAGVADLSDLHAELLAVESQ
jgi:hypothetical protein